MSRWLKSVNNLLEQLDGQVGEAIEEGRGSGPTSSSVEDILHRRGLASDSAIDNTNNDDIHDINDGSNEKNVDNEEVVDKINQTIGNCKNDVDTEKNHNLEDDYDHASRIESLEWKEHEQDSVAENENEQQMQHEVEEFESKSDSKSSEPEYEKLEIPKVTDSPLSSLPNENNMSSAINSDGMELVKNNNEANESSKKDSQVPENESVKDLKAPEESDHHLKDENDIEKESEKLVESQGIELSENNESNYTNENGDDDNNSSGENIKQDPQNVIPATLQETSSDLIQKNKFAEVPSTLVSNLSKKLQSQSRKINKNNEEQMSVPTTVNNQLKSSEKEIRKLRRHIVDLNTQLESIEVEMTAQSTELTRAAQRMERDRSRHKEALANMQNDHEEAIHNMQAKFQSELEQVNVAHSTEIRKLTIKLQEAEITRAQEGGTYQEDLQGAIEREQQVLQKYIFIQEEKSTLENQIRSLETQLSSLNSAHKSLKMVSDTATEREREAEDKLDAAFSLHAKQIGIRMSREQELERTIADLTAALVLSKQMHENEQTKDSNKSDIDSNLNHLESDQNIVIESSEKDSSHVPAEDLRNQLETIKVQFDIEKLKTHTLQQELQEISKERTEEEAIYLAQQRKNERQMNDVQAIITQLQARLKLQLGEDANESKDELSEDIGTLRSNNNRYKKESQKLQKQVAFLTEQSMKEQSKSEKYKSEVSTLNNRLRQAIQRAEHAEKQLTTIDLEAGIKDQVYRMDINPTVSLYGKNSSHTGKVTKFQKKRRNKKSHVLTMREALQLNDMGGMDTNIKKRTLGNVIDCVDQWCMEIGM